MQALVLAAGWATRLGDLTGGRPKHLLPIGSRTALDFVVDRLGAVPLITHVSVITHDVGCPSFIDWSISRTSPPSVSVLTDRTDSVENRLGSIGDMAFFIRETDPNDDLIVVAGDNVFDFDLRPLADAAQRNVVVGLYDVKSRDLASRYGVVDIDANNRITSFVEKPECPESTLAAVAIYGFPRAKLEVIQNYLNAGGSPDQSGALIEWLHTREYVVGHVFDGRWIDIGGAGEYYRAVEEFGS
jgi:glucose-1-phosphate thymidylyltransferase